MKINKIIIEEFYIPYIYFPSIEIEFKKLIEIDEMEAILFSFLYDLKENNANKKSERFFDVFFETFNLDKNKWLNFFKEMISLKIENKEIEINNNIKEIDDNILCGEISLHRSIASNISKKKFIGLDSKSDIKKIEINKILYESIKTENFILFKQLKKINDLTNKKEIINSKKELDIRPEIWSKEEEIIKNESFYGGEYKIIDIKKWEEKEIRFHSLNNVELSFEFNSDLINFFSENTNINEIFDKFNEEKINEIIIWSINNSLQNENWNILEELDSGEVIENINLYSKIINQIKENINIFNNNSNLYIDNKNNVYMIGYKYIKTQTNKIDSKNIKLLTKKFKCKLDELIEEEIKNYKNQNLLNLIETKLQDNEKDKINRFLISLFNELNEYKSYKNYIISLLIDNSITIEQIKQSFQLDNFYLDDFENLVQKNREKYIEFSKKNIELRNNNSSLLNKKIIYLIEKLEIELSDEFLNKFKNDVTLKINNVINKIKTLNQSKELENMKYFDFKIELDKIKNEINFFKSKYITNKLSQNEHFKTSYTILLDKLNDIKSEYEKKLLSLQRKFEKFKLIKKNKQEDIYYSFEQLIKNEELRREFQIIRKYRNNAIHTSEEEFNLNPDKLKNEISKIDTYSKWLDDNEEELKKYI